MHDDLAPNFDSHCKLSPTFFEYASKFQNDKFEWKKTPKFSLHSSYPIGMANQSDVLYMCVSGSCGRFCAVCSHRRHSINRMNEWTVKCMWFFSLSFDWNPQNIHWSISSCMFNLNVCLWSLRCMWFLCLARAFAFDSLLFVLIIMNVCTHV